MDFKEKGFNSKSEMRRVEHTKECEKMNLKLCPFCGKKPDNLGKIICCDDCFLILEIPWQNENSEKEALEAWNKRAIPEGYIELKKVEEILNKEIAAINHYDKESEGYYSGIDTDRLQAFKDILKEIKQLANKEGKE